MTNEALTIPPLCEALIELETRDLHLFTNDVIEIGRSESSQIRIESPIVSRRHARIQVSEGQIMLFDLDSTNGTYVNGKRVRGSFPLYAGDKVTIGLNEFIVAA